MENVAYNIDCMEYMRSLPDKAFDLAVADPPYFSGPEKRGYYGSKESKIGVHRDYPISPEWKVPGPDYFAELCRVSKKYIVWGCNYFDFVFSHTGELCGINAIKEVVFLIAKLPPQIVMRAYGCFDTCGTECCRVKAFRKVT